LGGVPADAGSMILDMRLLHAQRRPSRVPSFPRNDAFRALKKVGGGGFAAAAVIPGIGALAQIGATHPNMTWIYAASGCFAAAVVAAFVGAVGEYLTRRVTDRHAQTLRQTAEALIESLSFGSACNYAADGHRPEEAFRAHYSKLAHWLDRWDEARRRQREDEQALNRRIDEVAKEHELGSRWIPSAARDDAAPMYELAEIRGHVTSLVAEDLRERRAPQRPALSWLRFLSSDSDPGPGPRAGLLTPVLNKTWIELPPRSGESQADWNRRADDALRPVNAFYEAVQRLPEFTTAVDSVRAARAFREEEIPGLVDDLRHILEIEPPRRRRRCPTCSTRGGRK
jgi:hypothetical protein